MKIKSFETAKNPFSADATTAKPLIHTNGSSNVKSTHENNAIQKNSESMHKNVHGRPFPKSIDGAFELPLKNKKDEETAEMELFGKRANIVKPTFSFNLPENSSPMAHGDGATSAKTTDSGILWKLSF